MAHWMNHHASDVPHAPNKPPRPRDGNGTRMVRLALEVPEELIAGNELDLEGYLEVIQAVLTLMLLRGASSER